jgi:uncharacterized protein (TIGR02466 family)
MDNLSQMSLFASRLYMIEKPEFLDTMREVSQRYLDMVEKTPYATMSPDYSADPQCADFAGYVSQTAWNILASQGYDMDNLVTVFTEMWTQEHATHSGMDTHIHGVGSQLSAFYFLDNPPNGCQLIVHDPRAAKTIINLREKDPKTISDASPHIFLTPAAGHLIFASAWLPHSFTRNASTDPVRFIHMNLSVLPKLDNPNVEIV